MFMFGPNNARKFVFADIRYVFHYWKCSSVAKIARKLQWMGPQMTEKSAVKYCILLLRKRSDFDVINEMKLKAVVDEH